MIENVIDGRWVPADSGEEFEKLSPATGEPISAIARSGAVDVDAAVAAGVAAQPEWASQPVAARGEILRRIARLLEDRAGDVAAVVAAETGKAPKEARGEVGAATEMGYFVAGEGRRFYGRTTTSAIPHRHASTVRQPLGVAGLIIAANTPIANVAWKVFPALLCGNAAVLKASEDTPETADVFARLADEAGLPAGVLNVVHGYGPEVGTPLAGHDDVDVISFTGSTKVGRLLAGIAAKRLAKICLELGGKNPLVVCDDADLEAAARAAALSAYSNAGQRCAAGSRIIVFDAVYDEFRRLLLEETERQRVGPTDDDDFGPVINERQLNNMLGAVAAARDAGAQVIAGGERVHPKGYENGFFIAPTLIEQPESELAVARDELFGPITTLHRVGDFDAAVELANDTDYGLTSAIWTASVHRGQEFLRRIRAGVAAVNGPTYGSEPHMPFGGLGISGNGWREAGTEALDVYSDLKTVYVHHDPDRI